MTAHLMQGKVPQGTLHGRLNTTRRSHANGVCHSTVINTQGLEQPRHPLDLVC
jgi:hypothetical protein